jgi:hypothetical protein
MERIWKEFGKNTQAGKILYELYGIGFKPEEHINYPKIIPKQKDKEKEHKEAVKSTTHREKKIENISKINYPELNKKSNFPSIAKVDLIKKRRNQVEIQKELDKIKTDIKPPLENNLKNRKLEIEKLQDRYQYEEKTYLPKKARPPKIVLNEVDNKNINEQIKKLNQINSFKLNSTIDNKQEDELSRLYDSILSEIDERYKHMEEMKKLGENTNTTVIMSEIKSRIQELRTLEKLRKEQYDSINKS